MGLGTRLDLSTVNNFVFNAGPAFGVDRNFCGLAFSYSETYECCETKSEVDVRSNHVVRWFYAFGTTNVTLRQQWITSPQDHYPSDLGLILSKDINASDPFFKVYCWLKVFGYIKLAVLYCSN